MFSNIDSVLFQDVSASIHHAKAVCDMKTSMGIQPLPWPSQSPDINPIENLWVVLERNRHALPSTLKDLKNALLHEWSSVAREPENFKLYIECMQIDSVVFTRFVGMAQNIEQSLCHAIAIKTVFILSAR
jgi:hypothetical protein